MLLARTEILRILGHLEQAARLVEEALAWSIETNHQEIYCKSQLAIAKLLLTQGNLVGAEEAVGESYRTAIESNLAIQMIDSDVLSGWISFQRGDYIRALAKARAAGDRAMDCNCDYHWGIVDSLYLEGKSLLAEGKNVEAVQKLEFVAEYRRKLRDPRLIHVERLLTVAKQ